MAFLKHKVAAFLILLLWVAGPKVMAQSYNFESYSVADGLALNTILSQYQDDRGYMWFGTNNGGVNFYDGNQFHSLSTKDGLLDDVVFDIIQDKHGNMVFGTTKGVCVYDGVNFTNYDSLPHPLVFCVYEDSKGRLWVGTKKGIGIIENGQAREFKEHEGLMTAGIFKMLEDDQGNMWFGTTTMGAVKYDGEQFTEYGEENGLSHHWVWDIYCGTDGEVMFGTMKGADRLVGDSLVTIKLEANHEAHIRMTVTSIIKTRDNELWFGTQSGIYRGDLKGNIFRRYKESTGLSSDDIWTMMEDREGNMWIGTRGKGVIKHKYHADKLSIYNKRDSLPSEDVIAIFQDKAGAYWFGTEEGITTMVDGEVHEYTYDSHEKKDVGRVSETYGIDQDSHGNMWFASGKSEYGVVMFDGNEFHSGFNQEQGLAHNTVYSISIDYEDRIWVGTFNGVSLIEGPDDTEIETFDFVKGSVNCILNDRKGNHWFGTNTGAVFYNGKDHTVYNAENGFTSERVRMILEDDYGTYWFGTNDGIYMYNGAYFKKFGQEIGLTTNIVYSMIFDKNGVLWVGTNKGMDRFDADAARRGETPKIKHFGLIDGFVGVECNAGAVCLDDQDRIWFGTVRGAMVYDPALDIDNDIEPATHITNIREHFEVFDWTEYSDGVDAETRLPLNLVMPFSKNHLTFDFVGISLTTPEKVKYKYRLFPLEEQWLKTSRNEAVYSHVPPGKYSFEVMSMNNDGLWNKEPSKFNFVVLPPWYQTWWFYTICVLIVGAGIYIFIVVRTRALKRQKEILEEQVRERTQELREEKEKVEAVNKEVLEKNEIIEEKNKDITDSINYAQKIQEALLPAKSRISQTSLKDFFILYYPKDIVSGDFYWFRKTEKMNFIAAVDCTGHGVPGAFMSMIGHNLLNQIVSREEINHPSDILIKLNNNLKGAFAASDDSIQTNDGMDMGMIGFDDHGRIEFSGAQRPAWVVRGGTELEQIKGSARPIGGIADQDWQYDNHVIEVSEGDTIYISSDGFQDQFGGPKGKKFMTKRLKELLVEIQPLDMQAQFKELDDRLKAWMEGYEQMDDILVIGLKF